MDAKNALYFTAGAVLGVAGTVTFLWFWEDAPENNDISEDAPVKEVLPKPIATDKSTLDTAEQVHIPTVNYSAMANALYGEQEEVPIQNEDEDPKRITDDEFVELSAAGNYDINGYTLYADGILADSVRDDVISEADAFTALGPNYTARKLQRIFELGRDVDLETVCIRNDRLYTLYEITVDTRTYREVVEGDV